MATRDKGHVFISYARDAGVGQSWAERLEARFSEWGIPSWRDDVAVEAGEDWLAHLPKGLSQAFVLVLVVCRSIADRRWIRRELAYADDKGILVIPLKVEAGAELPFAAYTNKPVDFVADESAAWDRLERRLRALFSPSREITRELRSEYLDWLANQSAIAESPRVYVELAGNQSRKQAPQNKEPEEWLPVSMRLDKQQQTDKTPEVSAGPTEPFDDVIHAIRQTSRVVVLGEPGAGKTFALRRIAAHYAERAGADGAEPIPVFVRLGGWISAKQSLLDYIDQQVGPLRGRFSDLRETSPLCLLVDGLNELPTVQRSTKAAQILQLAQAQDLALCVVSCRENDYKKDFQLPLDTLTIQPLDPPRIHTFVARYFRYWRASNSEQQAEEVFRFLIGGDGPYQAWQRWQEYGFDWPRVISGAEPPPVDRGWLDRLLPWRKHKLLWLDWQLRDDYESLKKVHADERSLLHLAGTPYVLNLMLQLCRRHGIGILQANRAALFKQFVDDLIAREDEYYRRANAGAPHPAASGIRSGLGRLAWVLQTEAGGSTNVQLAMESEAAGRFMSDLQLGLARAAGILEVGENVRFTHQLLQEYFTALGMSQKIKTGDLKALELWPGPKWWERTGWEEAAVFLAGLSPDDPSLVIDWLADAQPGVLRQCLEQSGCAAPSAEQLHDLQARWLPRIDPEREPAPEARHAVALALGYLGLDRRPGVTLRADGLPDIAWLQIPGGEFLYGDDKERRELPTFYMARYPITSVQYQSFIDAGGYKDDRWWAGFADRIDSPRPPAWSEGNRPRESVSWYEAMAFCRWLSDELGYQVRLPTEPEWERAARGTDGREYPWGDEYRSGYANVEEKAYEQGEHALGEATAVGLYSQGASPDGVQDVAGNVWEWCLNEYEKPERIDPGGAEPRALRGGSWGFNPGNARASLRLRVDPDDRLLSLGFRVMCSSPIDR